MTKHIYLHSRRQGKTAARDAKPTKAQVVEALRNNDLLRLKQYVAALTNPSTPEEEELANMLEGGMRSIKRHANDESYKGFQINKTVGGGVRVSYRTRSGKTMEMSEWGTIKTVEEAKRKIDTELREMEEDNPTDDDAIKSTEVHLVERNVAVPFKRSVSDAARDAQRLLETVTNGKAVVKIYREPETNEYICKLYVDGKYQTNADYFTDDLGDAKSTAIDMARRAA